MVGCTGESGIKTVAVILHAQGEWTVVQTDALQTGDQVVGDVASYIKSDGDAGGGFGPPRRG